MADQEELLHSWATTTWPKILQGRGAGDEAAAARNQLLIRYHEAVYHYFLKKLRDPHAAQELYSNFALRLIESDSLIKRADPGRGRFRNYLKTALHNMVMDYHRRKKRDGKVQPLHLDPGEHDVPTDDEGDSFKPIFAQELLNQAWKVLREHEKATGQLHYSVLRFQADHPEVRAPVMAEQLSESLGKPLSPDAVRQALHRAREKFATLLLEEVERSLQNPSLEELEEELIDLQLLIYCKRALDKRRAEPAAP
jgi:RNA polymerase sigma-70 factor (ECF subfamily)